MRVLQVGLVVGALLSCGRSGKNFGDKGDTEAARSVAGATTSFPQNQVAVTASAALPNPIGDMLLDAGVSVERMAAKHLELTTEEVDKVFVAFFGERATHTKEELRIIAFVEPHLDRMHARYARPRRFLVDRERNGWAVSVITLEALKRAEGGPGLVFHVVEEKGRLRITHLTNNG